MSFKYLINEHLLAYPEIQTSDLIKLAYQSVYGPYHLFNYDSVLANLLNEEVNVSSKIEYLGDKYARYYFDKQTDLNLLFNLLIKSMKKQDNDKLFLSYLNLIEDREGVDSYLKDGIRDIHHSDRYRLLYKPHYRVIEKDYASYFKVLQKVGEIIMDNPKAIIAIDGMCCSGKTYLSKIISSIYDVEVIHSDDFYLPKGKREFDWFDRIGGNMNLSYLKEALIQKEYQPFDCRSQAYGLTVKLQDKPLIVEGTYSLLIDDIYDFKIFLTCDDIVQLDRLKKREEDIKGFTDIWLVKERAYFDKLDINNNKVMIVNTNEYF